MFLQATLGLYVAGTAVFLTYLVRRSEALSRVALGVAGLGFLFHTVSLAASLLAQEHVPLASFHEAMSLFSWALMAVFLGVELRQRMHVLGAFILPLSLIALLSAAALPAQASLHPVFRTVWLHVTLSILGTVGFAVAFVAGIMYVLQDRLLKSKQFNVLYAKLPPLDFLDALNQKAIILGFPLLTLGIITGAISAELVQGSYLKWNSEQAWALATWVFYFVVLMGRFTVGWRAKKAAYLTIIGFAGVVLTFIGVVLKNHDSMASV